MFCRPARDRFARPGTDGDSFQAPLILISSQGDFQTEVRGGVFAAGLSVPLPRMAAKSKSRCGSTRTALKVKVEDEDDEGDSKDEGEGCVALVPFLFPTSYFLLPNY